MDDSSYRKTTKKELIERLAGLQEVAVDLLKEVDPHNLLKLIVSKAMKLFTSDGGSLYLKGKDGKLFFEVCLNDTVTIDIKKQKFKTVAEDSIANYCFLNNETLRIDDVNELPEDGPYIFNKQMDKENGYRTKSILCTPLVTSKGEVLGVIQIINKKNSFIELWPSDNEKALGFMKGFNTEDEELLASFASLASAALENSNLYKNIHNLLDGFVRASVAAIESRDHATRGHSERVAILTVELAKKISRNSSKEFKNVSFNSDEIRELYYASLLHDFGKIGVKEDILLKANKLFPEQKNRIFSRISEFGHVGEIRVLRELLEKAEKEQMTITSLDIARADKKIKNLRSEINSCWNEILTLNETTILDQDQSKKLHKLCQHHYHDSEGNIVPLLQNDEVEYLSIKRGSLTEEERIEINSHVSKTFKFLNQIPWTDGLKNLPAIAHAHHEKLDGTGYPLGLTKNQIPVQARIMAITDIFDALVAMDRPYKKAISFEKALDILSFEANDGKLSKPMLQVFIEAKVFEDFEFMSLIKNPGKKFAA